MKPRNCMVTIHHERREFESVSVDGNTPNFRIIHETEKVRAKVWPVAMSANELLVEFDDGRLDAVELRNISLRGDEQCPHCDPEQLAPIKEKGPNTIRLIHERDTWHIAANIEFDDGTFLQSGEEIRRAVFSEPVSFCPKCGRKLV